MVVLSTSKTREDLTTAIRNMRFYASNDCNVRLDYTLNSTVMGGSLTSSGKPNLNISITDPDPIEAVDSLYIYAGKVGDPVVLEPVKKYAGVSTVTFDASAVENVQPDNTTYYYYTMIKQADGNRVISSPIWYSRNDAALPVTLVTVKAVYVAANNITQVQWSTAQEINSKDQPMVEELLQTLAL
jgi:formylglycine-generating enzyme required for sulfatase activity